VQAPKFDSGAMIMIRTRIKKTGNLSGVCPILRDGTIHLPTHQEYVSFCGDSPATPHLRSMDFPVHHEPPKPPEHGLSSPCGGTGVDWDYVTLSGNSGAGLKNPEVSEETDYLFV